MGPWRMLRVLMHAGPAPCGHPAVGWLRWRPSQIRTPSVSLPHAGFWGQNDKMKVNNPGGPQGMDWASKAGQDFISQHVISVIDFATLHIWPDNWLT